MNLPVTPAMLICLLILALPTKAEESTPHLREAAKFRFEFDNDTFFKSDNQFSNGWNFRIHSAIYDSWESITTSPQWVRSFGRRIPTLQGKDFNYRTGFSVGQVISTPANLKETARIENDVPYVGLLAGQISWTAYNANRFRSFGVTLGTIGRSSLAEQSQNVIHSLIDSEIAEGWDNQVGDELAFNLNYVAARKIAQSESDSTFQWDVSLAFDAGLGNVSTLLGTGLEARFGLNLPRGFRTGPEITGISLGYDATLSPLKPTSTSVYGSFSLGAFYWFHQLFVDGSLFSDQHGEWIEGIPEAGIAILGLHLERRSWAAHLFWVQTTDNVDVDQLDGNEDIANRFLSITAEWKI